MQFTFSLVLLFLSLKFSLQASCPAPVVDYTNNFAFNGDFELPDTNGGYIKNQPLPGWVADTMELGRGSIYNNNWGTSQVIELAADKNENYTKVETLTEGKYFLSLQYACRKSVPLASSGMNVYWNNNLILSVLGPSIGNYNIHTQTFVVDAVEGQNSLTLL